MPLVKHASSLWFSAAVGTMVFSLAYMAMVDRMDRSTAIVVATILMVLVTIMRELPNQKDVTTGSSDDEFGDSNCVVSSSMLRIPTRSF
jgi:hypothetical protein